MQVKAVCRLNQYGAGVNCSLCVRPLLPQSTTGGLHPSSPISRQQHQCLRIQNFLPGLLMAAVDTAPPPCCHLGTLPLDSLSLAEQADW